MCKLINPHLIVEIVINNNSNFTRKLRILNNILTIIIYNNTPAGQLYIHFISNHPII